MGCDIHSVLQRRDENGCWETVLELFDKNGVVVSVKWGGKNNDMYDNYKREIYDDEKDENDEKFDTIATVPFMDNRNYVMFGFLAGVRYVGNYVISEPRGLPEDIENSGLFGDHSESWLMLSELLECDYDYIIKSSEEINEMTDLRKITTDVNNFALIAGQTTYREYFGEKYFQQLELLKINKVERLVFGFDS